jgi:MFS family permease
MARYNYLTLFVADALTTAIFGFIVLFGIRETRPAEAHYTAHVVLGERISQLKRGPILLLFSLITLFFGLVYTQGYVSLPLDMQSHGLGPERYGVTIAVNGFLIILLTIPVSNMAAKWPRFETVAVAAALLGLGFGFTALASNVMLFALSVAIWTLGEIAATSVAPTIIADLSPIDLRGLYQGVFGAAWGLADFIGPLVGGWVYERLGSDTLWIGCFVTGLILAFCYYALSALAKRHLAQSNTVSSD